MTGQRKYSPNRRVSRNRKARKRAVQISIFGAIALALLVAVLRMSAEEPMSVVHEDDLLERLMKVDIPADVSEDWLTYEGFQVSFNPEYHQPNYSSWYITQERVNGSTERKSRFRNDPKVPGCATLDDYRNSGYDRGHMAPAADMKWSAKAMSDCHYLTNICPQNHKINGGCWNSFEQKCRNWTKRDSLIVVICGPVLSDILTEKVGEVPVPKRFFKVAIAPYTVPPMATGMIVPNASTDLGLEEMTMTVDQVEEITGFDFFSALPDDIEAAVESRNSYRLMNIRRKNAE
ncbi:MAG: DNA/RNA non-specific endonuclease [Muribaculaceae bacterium]|nr:DNA/RNA non-specific endonuclease [Muribaculaceae bacterium]